jgi:hypothetical protein
MLRVFSPLYLEEDMHMGVWRQQLEGVTIGRLYYYSPILGEQYCLWLLLTTVRGPQSFMDLY